MTSLEQMDGVLALNKPGGITSAACIARIKRGLGQKKIGHAGTLDPMAEGVLLVLLGQATKLSGYLLGGGEKVYSGRIKLGESTDTWDAEGRLEFSCPPEALASVTQDDVRREVLAWQGVSVQQVPPYSAAKHRGKPLYELARKGLPAPDKEKTIEISRAELEWFEPPFLRFRVACGSGTYIRSLAHSLGIRLKCGATLVELTREYSHPFGLDRAHSLDDVLSEPDFFFKKVVPLAEVIKAALPDWQEVRLDGREAALVRNGGRVPCNGAVREGLQALLLDPSGTPLALAEAKPGKPDETGLAWSITRGLWNQ